MPVLIDGLVQDVRFSLRQLRRAPALTATLIAVLGVGIGANTALFALLHAVTGRPAPGITADPSVVRIRTVLVRQDGSVRARGVPPAELAAYRDKSDVFSSVAGWAGDEALLDAGAGATAQPIEFVTPSYFHMLGVRSEHGTALPFDADPAAAVVAVASHEYWTKALTDGVDPDAPVIRLNGVPVRILGVLPRAFGGVDPLGSLAGESPVLWLPASALHVVTTDTRSATSEDVEPQFAVIARIHEGVSMAQASAVAATVATRYPGTAGVVQDTTHTASVVPLRAGNGDPAFDRRLARVAAALSAVTLLVLLVACANASTLLLIRALARRREIGVRLALGARRSRVVRQLLVESSIVALAASALGLLVLWTLLSRAATHLPGVDIQLDWAEIAFTILLAAGAGIVFGVAPALHGTRASPGDVLRVGLIGQSVGRARLHRSLVVAQIALSQPLLVGLAALLWFSFTGVSARAEVERDERLMTLSLDTHAGFANRWNATAVRDELMNRLASVSGVRRVASYELERSASPEDLEVHPADRVHPAGALRARLLRVGPAYFDVLGTPIVRGRDFISSDVDGAPNALILDASVAQQLWGNTDPVGRRLVSQRRRRTYVVVGVVREAVHPQHSGDRVLVYGAEAQGSGIFIPRLLIATERPASTLYSSTRRIVRSIDSRLPEPSLSTVAETKARRRRELMRMAGLTSVGGLLVLILAAAGLFSVIAFGVGARKREIAVRMALGAESSTVGRMFFLDGLKLSVVGVALGLPVGIATLGAFMGDAGVARPNVPLIALGASVSVMIVAMAASWGPSRRAASVSPQEGMRLEG